MRIWRREIYPAPQLNLRKMGSASHDRAPIPRTRLEVSGRWTGPPALTVPSMRDRKSCGIVCTGPRHRIADRASVTQLQRNGLSSRKEIIRARFDQYAPRRERWAERNRYFYEDEVKYIRFLIPRGQRVVELGCGTGRPLAALEPELGVGVDPSPQM